MMTEKPILFSAPMVRALLAGAKTQTRREIKLREFQPSDTHGYDWTFRDRHARWHDHRSADLLARRCPYGVVGDRLWVRETWQAWGCTSTERDEWEPITREARQGESWADWIELRGKPDAIEYCADSKSHGPWTPAIHMPRWASRITLELIEVRVQRLQAISEEDARAEGVERDTEPCDHTRLSCAEIGCLGPTHRSTFADLWDRLNGKRAAWSGNPWVWALTFRTVP